jgi:hypothetical protein
MNVFPILEAGNQTFSRCQLIDALEVHFKPHFKALVLADISISSIL